MLQTVVINLWENSGTREILVVPLKRNQTAINKTCSPKQLLFPAHVFWKLKMCNQNLWQTVDVKHFKLCSINGCLYISQRVCLLEQNRVSLTQWSEVYIHVRHEVMYRWKPSLNPNNESIVFIILVYRHMSQYICEHHQSWSWYTLGRKAKDAEHPCMILQNR